MGLFDLGLFDLGLEWIQGVSCFVQQTLKSHAFLYLCTGLISAYGLYLFWLGLRPIVIIVGLMIVVSAALSWQLAPAQPPPPDDDLLDPDVFRLRYQALFQPPPTQLSKSAQVFKPAQGDWAQTRTTVDSIHKLSVAIAQQEPLFIPDLLDTLHTVLSLAAQYTRAFRAIHKMKTVSYQRAAQKQLDASRRQLANTYQQLQELHDQLLTENIDAENAVSSSEEFVSAVSIRLQTLIDTNKTEIAES